MFDDDLADLWHMPPPTQAAQFYARTRASGSGRLLSVYLVHAPGTSPPDVPGSKQTGVALTSFHVRLPCEAASVPQARERLREWCHEARIRGDVVADVQLAVTEAAANAVRHADCVDFEVQGWMRHATVIVSVWDQGRGRGDPKPGAGLGTRIIRALAESVDVEDTQPGTRVTMRFPRHIYLQAAESPA